MMKHMRNLGVMALLALSMVGCADSITDPADSASVTAYDPYDATLLDETLMTSYSEVPTVEQTLLADSAGADSTLCDSLRGGGPRGKGPGGRNGHHGGGGRGHGRDGGIGDITPLGIRNYRAVIARLGLNAQQDSLFRVYLSDLRECAEDPAATYRAAREAVFAQYKPAVDSVRAAVKAGTITREEAKTRLDSIRTAFEAAMAPLNEDLRTALETCRATFDLAVESMLTPEQLAIWEGMKG